MTSLATAVQQLAAKMRGYSDGDLSQPYRWRAHEEGVRFALLGTYHELRELAAQLGRRRATEGQPPTLAQRALAPYHAGYRELQALLLGVDRALWEQQPTPNDWPLRVVVAHLLNAERTFFALVHYGLERQRAGETEPAELPAELRERLFGDEERLYELYDTGSRAEIMALYDELHRRSLTAFAEIDDEALDAPSLWWEGEAYPLRYRLHRFDAHLRQHTVQAEQTLARLGQPPTEARQLIRLVYQALAEVESVLLGAEGLGSEERQALAERVEERTDEVAALILGARALAAVVAAGNREGAQALLRGHPALADARSNQGISLLLDALYRRQQEIANLFVEAGATLSIMEGAALGRQDVVEAAVAEWAGWVHQYNADGFTPLQLACFFGHEETARYLLQNGADVHAVARNEQQIQPLHAAAAGPAASSLVALLLAQGADPNARQQQGLTALHTAAQQGDVKLARLLLDHGADPNLADEAGRTAADLAEAQGHEQLLLVLSAAGTS